MTNLATTSLPPPPPPKVLSQAEIDRRTNLAKHPDTPAEVWLPLAADSIPGVRAAVASRSDLTSDALSLLTQDTNTNVRSALARNPSAPSWVLDTLSRDMEDSYVLVGLASNPAASADALGRAVRLPESWPFDPKLQKRVAPPGGAEWAYREILGAVARHANSDATTLARTYEWFRPVRADNEIVEAVLRHPNTDNDSVLEPLSWDAAHVSTDLLVLVARHQNLEWEACQILVGHKSPSVREALAGNPASFKAVEQVPEKLLKDKDERVRRAATKLLQDTSSDGSSPYQERASEALRPPVAKPLYTAASQPEFEEAPLWQWFRRVFGK
jgi:hypothetical protein